MNIERACALLFLTLILFGVAPCFSLPYSCGSLVPIKVLSFEDYADKSGYAVLGLPFPPGELWSEFEARVVDEAGVEVPSQLEPLARWPDGSIMWLLVTFECNESSGSTYYLEYGEEVSWSPPATAVEVVEDDDEISVYTGAVNVTVGKENGVLRVWLDVDGDRVPEKLCVDAGYFAVKGVDEIEYLSTARIYEVVVEKEGPLVSVVRVRGGFADKDGHVLLNYSEWIYLYRDRSYLRILFREENNLPCLNDGSGQPSCLRLGSPNSVRFEDLSFVLNLTEGLAHFLAPLDGAVSSDFNSSVVVYQDSSGGDDWDRWPGVSFRGFRFLVDCAERFAGDRYEGWLAASGPAFGVLAGVRFFWENYPKAIEVSGRELRVRLMPTYFSTPFEHRAGEHKTHEILLYFYPSSEPADDVVRTARLLFSPLYARAPAEWYMRSGVFDYFEPYDPETFKFYEANNLAAVNGSGGQYADNLFDARERVDFYGWMHFGDVRVVDEDGGTGQMNLQYDFGYGMLVQSLRLAGRDDLNSYRWWVLAEQALRHETDIDVLHVHGGDPEQPSSYWIRWCWGGMFPHTPHEYDGRDNPHRGSSPHLEFQWNRGLIYYYYLTGYPPALEAALEVSENTYWRVMNGPGEPGYSGTTSDEARAPANALDILVNAYFLTGDPKYLEAARKVVKESHFNSKWYRDGPNPDYADRTVAPWQVAMLMVSLGRYLDAVRLAEGRIDWDAVSSLLGYADWMLRYCYHSEGNDASSYPHFIYRSRGDGVQLDWSPKGGANAWQVKIADAYAYAWIYSGNETYLKIAEEQFRIGSMYFWFEGNPIGRFATGKNHAILSTGGGIFMGVYTGRVVPVVNSSASFVVKVVDAKVVRQVIYLNITVKSNATISAVQYGVNGSGWVSVEQPTDGEYDSSVENVEIVVNASSYEDGRYVITVRAVNVEGSSAERKVLFVVRSLRAGYSLIALSCSPLKSMHASDIAAAVGPELTAIWRWRSDKQEFEGYIPGFSGPERDFPIVIGEGYFIYLTSPSKLVELGALPV